MQNFVQMREYDAKLLLLLAFCHDRQPKTKLDADSAMQHSAMQKK